MGKITKILFGGGLLLVLVMIIHISIAWVNHANRIEYSAPASVNLLLAVYYMVPIFLLFGAGYVLNKRNIAN